MKRIIEYFGLLLIIFTAGTAKAAWDSNKADASIKFSIGNINKFNYSITNSSNIKDDFNELGIKYDQSDYNFDLKAAFLKQVSNEYNLYLYFSGVYDLYNNTYKISLNGNVYELNDSYIYSSCTLNKGLYYSASMSGYYHKIVIRNVGNIDSIKVISAQIYSYDEEDGDYWYTCILNKTMGVING